MMNIKIKEKIENASAITILTHVNPDTDTIGTALGIYALLKENKIKRVEVVNASNALPIHLDFLPNYKKIKHQMDYTDSLIITCDCANRERLGFDVKGRDILNIDHHQSNTQYGNINVVLASYASSSQVAYSIFENIYTINKDTAECFYTALLSDTRYFTSSTVNREVFTFAQALLSKGVEANKVAYHLKQRQSLASLRILERGLASLCLYEEAQVSILSLSKEEQVASGAKMIDMEGIVDYGISLSTVEIALCLIELDVGIRVSLRSKRIDITPLAMAFGGGGHKFASGFILENILLVESIEKVLVKIKELGMLDGI